MLGPRKLQLPTPRRAGQPRSRPLRNPVSLPSKIPRKKAPRPKVIQKTEEPVVVESEEPEPQIEQQEEPIPEITYNDIATKANEIMEIIQKTLPRPEPAKPEQRVVFAQNPMIEIRNSLLKLPPIQIETKSTLFALSKVKTPELGFSIRKRQENQHHNVNYLPTPPSSPLPRLSTTSEMIYPDGRRAAFD